MLFLNAGIGIDPGAAALDLLGQNFQVFAPSHPGFDGSERPASIKDVDDLSYFYLDFLDALDLRDVVLVGVSMGAWIAAEMAVKCNERLSRLVMASPVGVKVSDRETRDIADLFAMTEEELHGALFADPQHGLPDYKTMPDSDVLAVARNRESLARFTWSPYMHDPKLKNRLHRIKVPALFLHGAEDGLISEDYVRKFSGEVPDAVFESVPEAGHMLQLDQPDVFAERVLAFSGQRTARLAKNG